VKGFPNQVANLSKLATGMADVVRLVDQGDNARNDGVLGEAFVRSGVAGRGHGRVQIPIAEYLRQQRAKRPSNQSMRTTARGLRELFQLLGLIVDDGAQVEPTDLGRQAAALAGLPMNTEQIDYWRRVIGNINHDGGDGQSSHPYQVLLRLVGQRPGITRARCALALEARNDSAEELARIVALADLPEDQIRTRIGETKANWDNAKKVLPSFAEQLGDVVKTGDSYVLADAPGRDDAGPAGGGGAAPARGGRIGAVPRVRAPRTSRRVTPTTIGVAGTGNESDEVDIPPTVDPAVVAEAIRSRRDRLRRHNTIVRELAARMVGAELHEDPFDILAVIEAVGILWEVKTLDGTVADERDRVRDALSQLLYYEAFVTEPVVGAGAIHKIACFESAITADHQRWLNDAGIGVVWKVNGGFAGDALATGVLGRYFQALL
jgi:hypothetical protein